MKSYNVPLSLPGKGYGKGFLLKEFNNVMGVCDLIVTWICNPFSLNKHPTQTMIIRACKNQCS